MHIRPLNPTLMLSVLLLSSQPTFAEPAQVPLLLIEGSESLTMINMSNDHELYFKAYDDYSDVDGDGTVDTTYNNGIEYYGYFDGDKCYSYDTTDDRFEAAAVTGNHYCDAVSGDWSGNFLNWATMTRVDAIRKVLYGGYRSTDTSIDTVLERTFLPKDAHAFAKYYNGSDIARLTPFSAATEISMCNLTQATSGNSKDNTGPPLLRVASGNFALWNGHESRQCQWSEEHNSSNSNNPAITGSNASASPPSRASNRLGGRDFNVRVQVCTDASLLELNCQQYPSGNYKPIGLLQEHGEDGSAKFGLMTGSYDRNKSGGVLRKNISDFRDELNETTDGTFAAAPATGGIVDTLNKFRLTRYDFNGQAYNSLDSCTFAQFGFDDGQCSNWGNPQSEIYLEALRYFSGLSATAAYSAPDDNSYINNLGSATWSDPLSNDNYCSPVNILHFNASTSSFDGDQLAGFANLPGSPNADTQTDIVGSGEGITDATLAFVGQTPGSADRSCSPKDLDNLSDAKGVCPEAPWLEGTYHIAGMAYYVNQNSIRSDLTDIFGQAADVRIKTYAVALSPAQPLIEVPIPGNDTAEPVILLPACMEFREDVEMNLADQGAQYVDGDRHNGNCAIVDFRVIEPHTVSGNNATGKFLVLWESAQHGGDYDQDMGGVIEYEISSAQNTIEVTTQVFAASTGGIHGFGYVISGTTQDGLHIHSGHNNFDNYADPYGLLDCADEPADGDCDSGDAATSITYTLGETVAKKLETPLFYAAKWGGFNEEEDAALRPDGAGAPNDIPDEQYEWDADGNGLPDNYFFARNPGDLSGQLATVFDTITTVSSSASAVANSVSLRTTTRIYQARFDSGDWSGQLLSFPADDPTGDLLESEWDAGEIIADQDFDTEREWITWDGSAGVPFRWDDNGTPDDYSDDTTGLTEAQRDQLNLNIANEDDGRGPDRINYLRGDDSLEQKNGGIFRSRTEYPATAPIAPGLTKVLGDVVQSTPVVVGAPRRHYRDIVPATGANFEAHPYSAFKTKYGDSECYESNGTTPVTSWTAGTGGNEGGREPMVYFGSNGGALHVVSACTGHERLAYVPATVYENLSDLTAPSYSHLYFVDGAPTVVDAYLDSLSRWGTVAVGSLAAGGKGIFALDVTDPNDFDESNAASIVLWDISPSSDLDGDSSPDYPELGYTFSKPRVIKADGHGWVAVFGNGYHGASDKAVLYMSDLDTGAPVVAIDLSAVDLDAHDGDVAAGDPALPNGLSTVTPVDTDGDGDSDMIYAGDLNGNVWRFAAASDGTGFSVGGASLLYSAKTQGGDPQPITTRVEVGRHPLSPEGRILYFGTGKYYEFEDQDPDNAVTYNSMYAIWDRDLGMQVPSVVDRGVGGDGYLGQQSITEEAVHDFDGTSENIRLVSNESFDWVTRNDLGNWNSCSDTGVCGCFLDLNDGSETPPPGEKMIEDPTLRAGRLLIVTSIPSLEGCAAGGTSFTFILDAASCGRMDVPVFDLSGDGVFDFNDSVANDDGSYTPVSGVESSVGMQQGPAVVAGIGEDGDSAKIYQPGTIGDVQTRLINMSEFGNGRKSWMRLQ